MPKKFKILTIKDKKELEILKNKSRNLTKAEIKSKKIQEFLENLVYTAKNHTLEEGWITAGLAAVQVGEPIQVFVVIDSETGEYKEYINPELEYLGNVQETSVEGCLSLPKDQAEICRHKKIKIKYLDRKGNVKKEKYSEHTARVIQHEYDHLHGILFTDKLK